MVVGYPAVRIFFALLVGIEYGYHYTPEHAALRIAAFSILILSFILVIASLRFRALSPARDLMLLLLLVCGGAMHCTGNMSRIPRTLLAYSDTKDKVLLRGDVTSAPRITPTGVSFNLRCRYADFGDSSVSVDETVMLYYAKNSYDKSDTLLVVSRGDVIEATGRLRSPRPSRNPWSFDARHMLLLNRATATFSVSKGVDMKIIGSDGSTFPFDLIEHVRHWMSSRINDEFDGMHETIMRGLLLGDRAGIDRDILDDFRAAGIMHILAVSGLHAGIIVTMVLIPLERLRYGVRSVLAIIAVWCFAGVTGFAPPVTRAAMMSTLFLAGVMVQRRGTSVNSLAAAGSIILLIDPLALFGLSFQLSFCAVLGILLFHSRIRDTLLLLLPKRLRKSAASGVISLLALTASAQSLTIPLTLPMFGEFSIIGFGVNLVAVPLVFVAVSCGLLSLVSGVFTTWLASLLASTASASVDAILFISSWSAAIPWSVFRVTEMTSWMQALYVIVVLYLTHREGRLMQKYILTALCLLAVFTSLHAVRPKGDVHARFVFLDVGQGDAALLTFPGASTALIDTGPSTDTYDSGSRVIVPYLRRLGIDTLDVMVLTHTDNDHIGGAIAVLNAVVVRRVLIACSWSEKGEAAMLRDHMRRVGCIVDDARAGDIIHLGNDARVHVYSPPRDIECSSSNEHSLVFMLHYGNVRALFTGDADSQAERRMIERYDTALSADILKVGHHGSTTSTSPGFLLKIRPKHAVIQVGRLNRFNHPRMEILDRLRLTDVQVHRTDLEGAIIFESDGERLWKLPLLQ